MQLDIISSEVSFKSLSEVGERCDPQHLDMILQRILKLFVVKIFTDSLYLEADEW